MSVSLKFSADQFRGIMAVMSMIKDTCDDLTIKEGKIHQHNNSKSIIYDIDLTEYFNESTLYINNIRQTQSLLSMFVLSNSEVRLKLDDLKYIWMDPKSKLESTIPHPDVLKNSWLAPTNTQSVNKKNITTKIFETTFDRTLLNRISQGAKTLECKKIILSIREDVAYFKMIPNDLSATTIFEIHEIDELFDEQYNCDIQYDIQSFLIATEELKMILYKNPLSASTFTMKFDAELEKVNVTMWAATNSVAAN